MITAKLIVEAVKTLVNYWGADGEKVIVEINRSERSPFTADEFLDHCIACGGNWGGMLLTGIKEIYPNVYDAIPDNMGEHAWECLISVITLLGVDCSVE